MQFQVIVVLPEVVDCRECDQDSPEKLLKHNCFDTDPARTHVFHKELALQLLAFTSDFSVLLGPFS